MTQMKLNMQITHWPAAGSCLQCLTQEEMNVCAQVTKLICVCTAFVFTIFLAKINFEIRAVSKVQRISQAVKVGSSHFYNCK